MSKPICFVCKHPIQKHPVYLAASKKHPEGLYRHIRCEAGSKRWYESEHGKASEVFDYFPEPKEEIEPIPVVIEEENDTT